jgi:hypothetical protein
MKFFKNWKKFGFRTVLNNWLLLATMKFIKAENFKIQYKK